MGISPEEALVKIPELNNNPSVITTGDELIIVPPSAEEPAETVEETEQAVEGEATPEAEPTAEGTEAEAAAESADQEVAEESAGEAAQGGSSALSQALLQAPPSSICVQVYEDVNGDGTRSDVGENPVADQAVTLRRGGSTISTYITDGSGDLYCFESLEPDTYQVQINPTADYVVVGDHRWAVAMSEGVMIPVSFGLQPAANAVADAGITEDAASAETAAVQEPAANGISDNMGLIVLGIAGVLVLVAGAGVYLLRRG
jgi:hypothetical protein